MAEQKDDSINPLFNKMNALMARHRGGSAKQEDDIPVLTQETIAPEIPVLQDEVPLPVLTLDSRGPDSGLMFDPLETIPPQPAASRPAPAAQPVLPPGGLMFDPEEFLRPPPPPVLDADEAEAAEPAAENSPAPVPPATGAALFMDLPLLDLDALSSPVVTTPVAQEPPAVEEPHDITLAFDLELMSQPEPVATAPASDELAIDSWGIPLEPNKNESFSNIPEEVISIDAFPPGAGRAVVAEEAITPPPAPLIEAIPEAAPPVTPAFPDLPHEHEVLDEGYWSLGTPDLQDEPAIDLATPADATSGSGFPAMHAPAATAAAASQLDPAYWALNTPAETPPADDAMLELAAQRITPTPHAPREADLPAMLIWEDPENGDILSIEPGPEEEDLQALFGEPHLDDMPPPTPNEPVSLSDADVQDISAMVGAHLAVEITAEVEQLTRQHFAKLMSSLYGDTLRQLTDAVCNELEAKIGERIVALVQGELKDRGLLGEE